MSLLTSAIPVASRCSSALFAPMLEGASLKSCNDRWNDGFGDKMLRNVAKHSLAISRGSDMVARLPGEAFAHLLIETNQEDVGTIA